MDGILNENLPLAVLTQTYCMLNNRIPKLILRYEFTRCIL